LFWLQLRLRFSKSFRAGSDFSFEGTCLHSIHIKKYSFHVFFLYKEYGTDLGHCLILFNMNFDLIFYFSLTLSREPNPVHRFQPRLQPKVLAPQNHCFLWALIFITSCFCWIICFLTVNVYSGRTKYIRVFFKVCKFLSKYLRPQA
jgi:hypothetical protein